MKRIISVLLTYILISVFIFGNAISVYAVSPIDTEKNSSLTLQYKHNGIYYNELEIKTYRIAEVFPDGTYALCGDFKDYPVNIYNITSKLEWDNVCSTLSSFIIADKLSPTYSAITDKNGTVSFKDIPTGMYLTLSVRVETDSELIKFESFITSLPSPDVDGNQNYDVTAYPKCEALELSDKEIEYKVIKHWQDNGSATIRPEAIKVDILKDGVLHSTQKLTKDNNWSYSWSAPQDGTFWQAIERNIPSNYKVTITNKENSIIITNVYDSPYKEPPKTGETTVLWPWILAMCVSGILVIMLSAWRKRMG